MFKDLRNEVKINFDIKTDSPLAIRSSNANGIDPTLPDMQCIRSYKDGESVVFIPGSSIKGILRSRCERILNLVANKNSVCNIVDMKKCCDAKIEKSEELSAEEIYKKICSACKMFGAKSLGGRFKFKDAYPIGDKPKIGYRNGVGINRITGAAQKGALYDFEVVEEGTFHVTITAANYELYQLKTLIWAISDINDGYVTFGSGSTRGNGKMLVENLQVEFRDYRVNNINKLQGYYESDLGQEVKFNKKLYYKEFLVKGEENVLALMENITVEDFV